MIGRTLKSLFLLLVAYSAQGQKMPADYYREAQLAERSEDYSSARSNYLYIVEHFPGNALCAPAYTSLGKIHDREKKAGEARSAYLMAIAYMNPQTKAVLKRQDIYYDGYYPACRLYDIHNKAANYDSALYYLSLYDSAYLGLAGCTPYYQDAQGQDKITMYISLLLKLRRYKEAEKLMLERYQLHELEEYYKEYGKPAELKTEFETAINNYSIDTIYENRDGCIDTMIYIKFKVRNVDFSLFYNGHSSGAITFSGLKNTIGELNKPNIIAYLKDSDLYKMVSNL